MKIFNFSMVDARLHIKKNSFYYITFIISIIIAVTIGVIVVISNENYLNLLVSSNKNLYSIINGSASLMKIFSKIFFRFSYSLAIVLFLGINYYLSLLSYIFVSYQFSIFFMTIFAIIDIYGFSGILICIFIIIPVNLIFFLVLIFMSVTCLERSKTALKNRYFKDGYNFLYWNKIIFCFSAIAIISFFVSFIIPLILKSTIFSIF